ncbi:hypothetical protein VTL71DRAFT_6707 [Oculimacula yallundae]|uniref:3'-5' exoribonuclease Rv2179c-like domain-containing protein n=1 Tax=Oculimacula yallundae TaxID=86028 RepID=A0ABR4BXQ2_9HELO
MDSHTNIMLDLECASIIASNPAIIEIGAIFFDLNTGTELEHFHTPISMSSCLGNDPSQPKLVTDPDTISWLPSTIPQTLQASEETMVTLEEALFKFKRFIEKCCKVTTRRLRELHT